MAGLLREFVYLDDVSVQSLYASMRGAIPAELTESVARSIAAEVNASAGIKGPVGAEVQSSLRSDRSSETQILRKAVVQTTFKDLYGLISDRIVLHPGNAVNPCNVAELQRGALVEVDVELSTEQIFQAASVTGEFLDLTNTAPGIMGVEDEALGTAAGVTQLLNRLLGGLVPLRGRMIDVRALGEPPGCDLVGPESVDFADGTDIHLVAVADAQLFWKDLRRVLFSNDVYRVLARVRRSGVRSSWTPVAMVDSLRTVFPPLADQIDLMARSAVPTMLAAQERLGLAEERSADSMRRAVDLFAAGLEDIYGVSIPLEVVDRAIAGALGRGESMADLRSRRSLFSQVAEEAQRMAGREFEPEALANLRMGALLEAGFDLRGTSAGSATGLIEAAQVPERLIECEVIAIYW